MNIFCHGDAEVGLEALFQFGGAHAGDPGQPLYGQLVGVVVPNIGRQSLEHDPVRLRDGVLWPLVQPPVTLKDQGQRLGGLGVVIEPGGKPHHTWFKSVSIDRQDAVSSILRKASWGL